MQPESKTTQGATDADTDAKTGIGVQVADTTVGVEESKTTSDTTPAPMQGAASAGAAFFADT